MLKAAPKSTASLLDLDPDDFMAGLADAGLEDDDSDGDGSEEDDKEQSLDEGSWCVRLILAVETVLFCSFMAMSYYMWKE